MPCSEFFHRCSNMCLPVFVSSLDVLSNFSEVETRTPQCTLSRTMCFSLAGTGACAMSLLSVLMKALEQLSPLKSCLSSLHRPVLRGAIASSCHGLRSELQLYLVPKLNLLPSSVRTSGVSILCLQSCPSL